MQLRGRGVRGECTTIAPRGFCLRRLKHRFAIVKAGVIARQVKQASPSKGYIGGPIIPADIGKVV